MKFKWAALVILLVCPRVPLLAAQGDQFPDLSLIGPVAPKGRVQDKAYNPTLPVVTSLISRGSASIPYLVSKLEDGSEIKGHVFDFWPKVAVGDVALVVLVDFFTLSDGRTSTLPGLEWDKLLERHSSDQSSWDLLASYIRAHGRSGLQKRVEGILALDRETYTWDAKEQCFRLAAAR